MQLSSAQHDSGEVYIYERYSKTKAKSDLG